jgi:tellurite resistance protein TehA-like permease
MADKCYDKTYRFLTILSIIFGIIFGVFVLGHTGMLIYERIKYPEKSKERWNQIEQNFNRKPSSRADTYLCPSQIPLT